LAEVRPFGGILFGGSPEELARVLAPPYDVISPEAQRALYDRDPRNIVRVVLNRTRGPGAYAEAAQEFTRLQQEGVLRQDAEAAHYLLEQTFLLGGQSISRLGLLARFRAEDPEHGRILPHERTRKEAREDRYRLLEATRANFSPIFLMFEDPGGTFSQQASQIAKTRPRLSCTDDDGVVHRLFPIVDPAAQSVFEGILADAKAYIADGHHRYATALRYRDAHGPEGAWTFGYFTPLSGPGLVVLPYHRLLRGRLAIDEMERRLRPTFELRKGSSLLELSDAVTRSKAPYAFAFCDSRSGFVAESTPSFEALLPKDAPPSLKALDTFALHQGLLGGILPVDETAVEFHHSLSEVERALSAGAGTAVLMRATRLDQIVAVSEAGESMPPKSTFFYPKLPSGLVIHPLP
jgi:uncharacterized protein (DUF1015 family)